MTAAVALAPAALPDVHLTPARLRRIRLAFGWTQGELARLLATSHGMVSRWEHGRRPLPPEDLGREVYVALARALERLPGRKASDPPHDLGTAGLPRGAALARIFAAGYPPPEAP